MLTLYVIPEIAARLAAGTLAKGDLPVQVSQFRVVMRHGKFRVEINEEAQVVIEVPSRRAIASGEEITLADIDAANARLKRPTIDGDEAAYYLFQSYFLEIATYFDFLPNAPGPKVDVPGHPFPVFAIVAVRQLLDTIKPNEQFKLLAAAGWPPAPAYYPNVLVEAHKRPTTLGDPAFAPTVASAYTAKYFNDNLGFWKDTNFFPGRLPYIEKAINEYLEQDAISSIHVIVPQFEGIVHDYLSDANIVPASGFKGQLKQLKAAIFSRTVLIFPKPVIEVIFDFLESGSFLKNTATLSDPKSEVNRHGIAHGVFTGFESDVLALKYLVLLDGLALVLLQDRMLTERI